MSKFMSNKIIADVSIEIKEKLYEISHANHEKMKGTIVRLIEQEHKKLKAQKTEG